MIWSVIAPLLFNVWQFHYSFSLWDEGFLWYGVQQVMKGGVPLRDFMAYDPGRYYALAALTSLWGNDSLLSLRWAIVILEMPALFGSLWVIHRSGGRNGPAYWLAATLTLMVWMTPYYKMADYLACALLLVGLTELVRSSRPITYFLAGVCVGFAAVWGRNHGVYGLAGSLGVMVWLALGAEERPRVVRGLVLWALGVVVGFSPVLLMVALTPGFALAMWESIRFIFVSGSTNIALPVPWPWEVSPGASLPVAIHWIVVGLLFMAVPLFAVTSVAWVSMRRLRGRPVPPTLVASAFLAVPYTQYAFSRADSVHLALSILPFLVGCLVLLAPVTSLTRSALTLALCAGSLWTMAPLQMAFSCARNGACVETRISGESFDIWSGSASAIRLLRKLARTYAPDGRPFLAVPYWPGAYAVLDRASPIWEIYVLFPRSRRFQEAQIARIEATKPGFIVVDPMELDGRRSETFAATHPLVYRYILDHYVRLRDPDYPSLQIFHPKPAAP